MSGVMKILRLSFAAIFVLPFIAGTMVFTQTRENPPAEDEKQQETPPETEPEIRVIPDIELPDTEADLEISGREFFKDADKSMPEEEVELDGVLSTAPDYSHLTKTQERASRLDSLFARLKAEKDAEFVK